MLVELHFKGPQILIHHWMADTLNLTQSLLPSLCEGFYWYCTSSSLGGISKGVKVDKLNARQSKLLDSCSILHKEVNRCRNDYKSEPVESLANVLSSLPNNDGYSFGTLFIAIFVQHYSDVIIGAMASQITSQTIVYSTVYSGADQRKHQSSASLALVREIHRSPVNSPHKLASNAKICSIWWRHHEIVVASRIPIAPQTLISSRHLALSWLLSYWGVSLQTSPISLRCVSHASEYWFHIDCCSNIAHTSIRPAYRSHI